MKGLTVQLPNAMRGANLEYVPSQWKLKPRLNKR